MSRARSLLLQSLTCALPGIVIFGIVTLSSVAPHTWAGAEVTSDSQCFWQQLPGGMDWAVIEISQDGKGQETGWQTVDPQRPLTIKVSVRNRTNGPIEVPRALYHDMSEKGPALLEGITMHLERAPFNPRSPDAYYPEDDDYAPVKPIRDAHFTQDEHQTLAGKQLIGAFTFDLRDWFEMTGQGYYKFHFEFDRVKLKLPNVKVEGASQISIGFTVGVPPQRIMPAELNRTIDVFGGKDEAAQLAHLIAQQLPPADESRSTPRPALPGKLAAIDQISPAPMTNAEFGEPEINGLIRGGWDVVSTFKAYDPRSVREELDQRFHTVQDPIAKLYLAAVAARYGSRAGALYLLEACKAVEEKKVGNAQTALGSLLEGFDQDPPDWAVDLALALLSDQRFVLDDSGEASGTISQSADDRTELSTILGNLKCRKAVGKLIELGKAPRYSSNAIMALGNIGDARAEPVLLEVLRELDRQVKIDQGMIRPDAYVRAAQSLAQFKCRQAVPILLRHYQYEEIISALESIGDPMAIPALKKLIAAPPPAQVYGGDEESARDAARIALVTLSDADPIPGYLKLLSDHTLNQYLRRSAVWRLGDRRDPRAISGLLDAIHNDPSGAVVNQAITVLAVFKNKSAVEGLIGCFDAEFAGKQDWKRAYKPGMFRENIARSLQAITGETFPPERDLWLSWWRQTGRFRADLK